MAAGSKGVCRTAWRSRDAWAASFILEASVCLSAPWNGLPYSSVPVLCRLEGFAKLQVNTSAATAAISGDHPAFVTRNAQHHCQPPWTSKETERVRSCPAAAQPEEAEAGWTPAAGLQDRRASPALCRCSQRPRSPPHSRANTPQSVGRASLQAPHPRAHIIELS